MVRGLRYTPEKPCDIIAGCFAKFVGIESKQIKKWEAFGLSQIRDTQIKAMDEMVASGNRAFVFLNVRIRADKATGAKHCNRLLIFEWKMWKPVWQEASTKKKELMTLTGIEGSSGLFDLSKWVFNPRGILPMDHSKEEAPRTGGAVVFRGHG